MEGPLLKYVQESKISLHDKNAQKRQETIDTILGLIDESEYSMIHGKIGVEIEVAAGRLIRLRHKREVSIK